MAESTKVAEMQPLSYFLALAIVVFVGIVSANSAIKNYNQRRA